jgi:small subunit ribosomal protein S16
MVRIRFRREGSKNQATFRIVAADRESPRDGRFLEVLGHYNPRTEPSTIKIDEARLFHWMKNGAQPSDSVHQALRALGTWDRWERYKSGEDIEVLLKEAEETAVEVDPRTRRDDLVGERKMKGKARKKAAEADAAAAEPAVEAEEAVPVEEPAAEAEIPADEAPVEEAPDAPGEEEAADADGEVEAADAPGEVEAADAPGEEEAADEEPAEEEPADAAVAEEAPVDEDAEDEPEAEEDPSADAESE